MALQDLAQNPKRLGGTPGLLAVSVHPDAHSGVLTRTSIIWCPAAACLDQRQWISSRLGFLCPSKHSVIVVARASAKRSKNKMPGALEELPPKVWTRWVVHSAAVGSGQKALSYLGRYVFKTATGNRQLQSAAQRPIEDGLFAKAAQENGGRLNWNPSSSCGVSFSTFCHQAFIGCAASDGCIPADAPSSSGCVPCSKCHHCFQPRSKPPGHRQHPAL